MPSTKGELGVRPALCSKIGCHGELLLLIILDVIDLYISMKIYSVMP
jgi:hypothetical protein